VRGAVETVVVGVVVVVVAEGFVLLLQVTSLSELDDEDFSEEDI
jgi:hypothetical protein